MQNSNAGRSKSRVRYITISADQSDQRIDNFLVNYFKDVPKSHIYKLIRKGEVRVNKQRITASYRLKTEDTVRLPPVYFSQASQPISPSQKLLQTLRERIVYEDDLLLILNKPSGLSVHAGSTVRMGVIEALRSAYPKVDLELAHRLDSETSGCLILAKKKRILRELHSLLREGKIRKFYWALTKGRWKDSELHVDVPLQKEFHAGGKHVVRVLSKGKPASTLFRTIKSFKGSSTQCASLMEIELFTGRTHQIRVHASHKGHPIAGDDRYGDTDFNKSMRKLGLKRMFLHARSIDFTLPSLGHHIKVVAPLDKDLERVLNLAMRG